MEELLLEASASPSVDAEQRTITGLVVPYGLSGSTSVGATVVTPGSVAWSSDTRRVKLLREHQSSDSLGFASSIQDTPAGLLATFKVPEGTNGDRALSEAESGIRDGLSVGLYSIQGSRAKDGTYTLTGATLREVSLVSVPAFDDARVTRVKAQGAAAQATNERSAMDNDTIEVQNGPSETEALRAEVHDLRTQLLPPKEIDNGRQVKASITGPNGEGDGRKELTLDGLATLAFNAAQDRGPSTAKAELLAALSDVVPANSPLAFRPVYLTELLNSATYTRKFVNNAVTKKPMPATGMSLVYPMWDTKPTVSPYAGDKAEIASNTVSMTDVSFDIERWAAGHDIDRAFIDRGDPAFITAFLQERTNDYLRKTNANVVTKALAAATVQAASDTLLDGVVEAVVTLASTVNNWSVDYIAISPDLFGDWLKISTSAAPAYLNGAVSLANGGGATVGGLSSFVDASLGTNTFLVGNDAGMYFHEATPPIEIQAVNLPNGGIDLAVFGYTFTYSAHADAMVKGSVTP